jgi:hypothetical protein
MLPVHMAIENIICTVFTVAASATWGTSLALAGFRPSEVAGGHSKYGKVVLSVLCALYLSAFSKASADFVVSGNRLLLALVILSVVGFFAGTVFGTVWRSDPAK